MYELSQFRDMLLDRMRMDAHVEAMGRTIRPGDRVVDLGAGVGYLAVLAARLGAGEVHAIEPNPIIQLGRELAARNGVSDRIQFHQSMSQDVDIPPADVVVADLRGVLPFLGKAIPTLIDARQRLLRPGGCLIPQRDSLRVALAEGWDGMEKEGDAPPSLHDVDLELLHELSSNALLRRTAKRSRLLSDEAEWGTIDYTAVESPDVRGSLELTAARAGTLRGLSAWFNATLWEDIGFTTGPEAPSNVYGQGWLSLPTPCPLDEGDRVQVELAARLVGRAYVMNWSGEVASGPSKGFAFDQSSFRASGVTVAGLAKRSHGYRPRARAEGAARGWMLGQMNGSHSLKEIADHAFARFPECFSSLDHALALAGTLSEEFSE